MMPKFQKMAGKRATHDPVIGRWNRAKACRSSVPCYLSPCTKQESQRASSSLVYLFLFPIASSTFPQSSQVAAAMGFSLRKSRSRSSRTKDSRNNTTATPSRPVSHKSNKSKHANNKKTKNLENEQTFSTAESEFSFIVHPPQNLSCEKDDDVSSIHFCESVSSPTYCFAESSSPRKTGVPSPPPLKFVRSDSNINQSRAAQAPSSPSARESATPPINNTTQPLPALTSLLFLSLVTFEHRHSSSGKHVVRETLQRHAYTTAEQQQLLLQDSCSRARRNSVPVDVDDCNFVSLEELEHVVLRHLHNRNISAAIEVYETLLEDDSQQSKSRLHQQLSVLWVLQGNRRKAVSCSKLAGTCLPSGESQQHVVALMNMGVMLLYNQKPREALEKFLLALQLECKLVGYHFSLIPVMLNNVAICHVILEEYDIATVLLQESLQLQRNVGHRADLVSLQHVATSLLNLGICAWKRREYGCAINWLEEGLLVLESCHDSDDALVQLCRITLEQLLEEADKNKNEIAVPVPLPPVFGYSDGIPLRHSSYAIDSVFLGSLKHELTLEKRVQNAVTTSFCAGMLRFPLSKKLPSFPIDLDRGTVLNAELHLQAIYAHVLRYIQTNEMEEALELLRSTLRGFKGKYGLAHHLVGMTMHNIALVYLNEGKYKDADWYFQEAVSVCVAACGSDHPYVAVCSLFVCLWSWNIVLCHLLSLTLVPTNNRRRPC